MGLTGAVVEVVIKDEEVFMEVKFEELSVETLGELIEVFAETIIELIFETIDKFSVVELVE